MRNKQNKPKLKNDCLIKALLRQPTNRTPVWIMRQAGRYLPEYRKLRASAGDFLSLCSNPQLACEVTLQPLRRYNLDAAILFSDILTIPDAMGLGLYFCEGEGPRFHHPLQTDKDVEKLAVIETPHHLSYVTDAVSLIRHELNGSVPLIGFSGSPWTLATYMIEGKSSRDFAKSKSWLYERPELLHQLLDKLTDSVINYLNAQINSGVQIVQIFDTWGGILSTAAYLEFSLSYIKKIVTRLISYSDGEQIPIVVFTKGGGLWLEEIAQTGCHCIGLDWTVDIRNAQKRVGSLVALQGNMDPAVLRASKAVIISEVIRILEAYGSDVGHIFNLGHGITPDVDPENVQTLVDAVHHYSELAK